MRSVAEFKRLVAALPDDGDVKVQYYLHYDGWDDATSEHLKQWQEGKRCLRFEVILPKQSASQAETVLPDAPEPPKVCPRCGGRKLVPDPNDRYEQPCPACFVITPIDLSAALKGPDCGKGEK